MGLENAIIMSYCTLLQVARYEETVHALGWGKQSLLLFHFQHVTIMRRITIPLDALICRLGPPVWLSGNAR